MPNRTRVFLAVSLFLSLAACSAAEDDNGAGVLLRNGTQALSRADYEAAEEAFESLAKIDGYACPARYGLMLADIQDVAAEISTLVEAAGVFVRGAPSLRPQKTDLTELLGGAIGPFEAYFADITASAHFVIDNGCRITVPGGYPLQAGDPESLLYFRAVIGDEFDPAAARAILAVYSTLQAGTHFLLSQNLVIESTNLGSALNPITKAFDEFRHVEIAGPGEVTQHTYLTVARSLGNVFVENPDLLSLGDAAMFHKVDNDLTDLFRALYARDDQGASGFAPALLAANPSDVNLRNNVVSLVDEGDGELGDGDVLHVGLRELKLGPVDLLGVEGGVEIRLSRALGDVAAVAANIHTLLDVLGDQMAAVDDPASGYRRLGLTEMNAILTALPLVSAVFSEPLPEAIEFDLRSFFVVAIGLRDLAPYTDDESGAFVLEGESWQAYPEEPFVKVGDAAHFADPFTSEGKVVALSIAADEIAPPMESLAVPFPLPYVAWREPSFRDAVYVDASQLPFGKGHMHAHAPGRAPASDGFEPADLFLINQVANAYASFVVTEYLHP